MEQWYEFVCVSISLSQQSSLFAHHHHYPNNNNNHYYYRYVEEMINSGRIDESVAPPNKVYGKLRARLSPAVPKLLPHDAYFYLNRDTCPMPFETPLFRGRAVVRVRGAKDAPKTRYFDGKRRMFSIQVEGRFRRRIRGDSVIFGAAFDHPVVLPYGTSLGLALLHRIDPAVRITHFQL